MKPKISACLAVYHEEKFIRNSIESFKDVVDEIILVHDGKCQDNTLNIAREYGAKIYERERIGNAEPHRGFSFAAATGDWILQIDPDEHLSPELRANLRKMADNKEGIVGYGCKWDTYCYKGKHLYEPKLCFFRKDELKPFLGIPHEGVKLNGKVLNVDYELVHIQPQDCFTWKYMTRKIKTWSDAHSKYLCDKNIAKRGAIPYFFKAFIWFGLYFGLDLGRYHKWRIALSSSVYNLVVWLKVSKIKLKKRQLV
ncbi:MAG: glycosyltransferase [Nanoarchaeota archaeon]|nr:glycosyltransferase [Nanoarchaeota archaeon]